MSAASLNLQKKPTQPWSGCGAERRAAARSCKSLLIDRWSAVITHGEGDEHAGIIGVGRQLEAFPEDYPLPPICAPGRSFRLVLPFLSSAVRCFAQIAAPRSFGHRWSIPGCQEEGKGTEGPLAEFLLTIQSPHQGKGTKEALAEVLLTIQSPHRAWGCRGMHGRVSLRNQPSRGWFGVGLVISPAHQGHFQACLDYVTFKRSLPTPAIRWFHVCKQQGGQAALKASSKGNS